MKYLSCPLCGTPEPDVKEDTEVMGVKTYVIQCLSCHRIVKIEDITDADGTAEHMKGLDDPNATVLVFKGNETDAELDAVEKVLEHELGARQSVVTDAEAEAAVKELHAAQKQGWEDFTAPKGAVRVVILRGEPENVEQAIAELQSNIDYDDLAVKVEVRPAMDGNPT
jgi:hypothetical protein